MKPSFSKVRRTRIRARIACYAAAACLLCLSLGCPGKQPPRAAKRQTRVREEHYLCKEWTREGLSTSREGRPEGGYVFLQWGETGHNYAVLMEGYGMMIFYEWHREPEQCRPPRFKLFAHDRGVIVETTDMAELKQAISQIPAGETLRLFDTCCASTHSGIDRAIIEEIKDFCRQHGIIYVDTEQGIICTCA